LACGQLGAPRTISPSLFFKTLKVSKKEWEFLSDMPSKCPAHVLTVLECDLIKYDAKCDKVFKLS
jgi:hypothetical protein